MSPQQDQTPQPHNTTAPSIFSPAKHENIRALERKLHNVYAFQNNSLALEALQTSRHPVLVNGVPHKIPGNKNLAILGDLLLDLNLWMQWRQSGTSPEEFSNKREHLVSNRNLHTVGYNKGLDICVIRGPGVKQQQQQIGIKTMATTVEAIIGAAYTDSEEKEKGSGMDTVATLATELGLDFHS